MATNRVLLSVLSVLVVIAGCSGADDEDVTAAGSETSLTTAPTTTTSTTAIPAPAVSFDPADEGTLVVWALTAGECSDCGYRLRFDAAGVASLDGDRTFSSGSYDAGALRTILAGLDPRDLVVGPDDCGREVDGNAPRIELHQRDDEPIVIDDCYTTVDREHPLMQLVLDTDAALEATSVEAIAGVTAYGGLCADGECRSTTRFAADGRWIVSSSTEARTGTVSAEEAALLVRLVDETAEDELSTGPFEGECPTAFDGQARTFSFGPIDDAIHVDTCRDEVDTDHPLIQLIDRLVAETSP